MLDVLFIIKRNSHGKYFAKLSNGMSLKTEVNYLGWPTLGTLFSLPTAIKADLHDNFIFIPFQVPNDSQIISNSPWIKSMEQFYAEVVSAFDTYLNDSLYLVFKEHPSWPKHYEHLYDKHPNILFANGNNTQDLIQKAKAVVTINSTVGLEALLLGKKVITLGNACYNVPGLVIHCPNSDVLLERIAVLDEWQTDEDLLSRFLGFLQDEYCIPEQWVDAGKANIHAVENRMSGQDGFLKEFEEVSVDNTHHKNSLVS